MLHRPLAAVLSVWLALALAACGGDDTGATGPPSTSSAAAETPAAAAEFPVTVVGDNGAVAVEERPDAIVSLSATATESLFAIGAGDAGDRGRRPVELPGGGAGHATSPASRPTSRRSPATSPTSSSSPTTPASSSTASSGSASRFSHRTRRRPRRRPTSRSSSSGRRPATWRRAERSSSRCGARSRRRRPARRGRGLDRLPRARPDLYTATSNTFIGRVYALLGLANVADAADKPTPAATRSSRRSTSSPRAPTCRPRRHDVLRPDGRPTVAKRPGWGTSRRSRTA